MAGNALFTGALSKLDTLIAKLRGSSPEEFGRNAKVVGERLSEAADSPDFFERGRNFALTDEGLAAQFGVGPKRAVLDPTDSEAFGPMAWRPGADDSMRRGLFRSAGLYEKDLSYDALRTNPSSSAVAADKAGLLSPRNRYRVFDTVTLDSGSGQGTRLYPAAYGSLLTHPNMYNIVDGLSADNAIRRNYNQASAALRDPALADRIITAPSQLRDLPTTNIADVHRMPAAQRIGALQLAGSTSTLASLRRQLTAGMSRLQNSQLSVPEATQLEFSLSQIAHRINRLDGTQGALSGLGDSVRRFGDQHSVVPFGDRTARRIGLSLRALDGDRNFGDITRKMEYRQGGSVDGELLGR